ncbi:hypothetical protein QE109_00155 [Fusibacter bizertensis]|uniref:Uncharacterized protein n=1 Tax=Fusibacter bizertensis TaxID=1488331 RepID=A0ABT6N7Y5_9FIRM|nr:hypothetical protein [Fusibacter bizertensis]MDH8676530.1 hypothetical protein [Fusibacter bizertensis]
MNKKIKIALTTILLLATVITLVVWFTRVPDFSTLSPAEITVIALPSPPEIFNILNPEDIEKVMTLLNDATYKKTIIPADKGWEISLSYPGTDIQLLDQYITVNGKTFLATVNISNQVKTLLTELGYLNH